MANHFCFPRLFFVLLFCLPNCLFAAEPTDPAIQGLWFCTDVNGLPVNHARRTVLLVRDTEFVLLSSMGVSLSSATYNRNAEYSTIDIDRYDGATQLGVYETDGASLRMTLSDPDQKRPDHLRSTAGKVTIPHSHYTFSRLPTSEGADVLRRVLSDDANLALIGETYDVQLRRSQVSP